LLIAFAVLLVALTVRPLRRPGTPHGRAAFVIVGALAVAAIAMPIAITTAGAIETQAFMLVYVLAAAFVLDAIVRAHERRLAGASNTTAGPPLGDGIQTGPDVATAMSQPRHTRNI
jgi:peptidoglycan/LPS O-acetylase OafA/YrhL